MKKEKGYTYAQIANLSGVPLGTVQKIFSGETVNPRYDTLMALEHFFEEPLEVREHVSNRYERNGSYTVDDYRTLPDEQRVELIDGYFYDMASPTFGHQSIGGEIHRQIANFIVENGGNCRPFIAPVDVHLIVMKRLWFSQMSALYVILLRFSVLVYMVHRIFL